MISRRFLLLLPLAVLAGGCGERRDPTREDETAFTHTRVDAVAVVVLDLSGSFEQLLIGRENRAFVFLQKLIQEFFYQGIGREQRLVIAQISGTNKALLFEGSLQDFNERFPDPDSFRDHLKRVGNPAGSRVYDSVGDALSYTLGLPAVEKGHTKVGLFVLSDWDDNVRTAQSLPQLEAKLKSLATDYRGAVGFYYVEQSLYPAALGASAVFAMFLLGILLSARFSFGLFLVAWMARLLVPGAFSLYWYRRYAEEVFPYLQSAEHRKTLETLDRRTTLADKQAQLADATKEADTRREDAERRNRRMRAIQEARRAVLNFYRSFAVVLRLTFGADRLQAELRAAIPDSASEEQAFAGACGLLTRLEGVIQGLEAERKAEQAGRQQRRQHIVGIETQIAAIGEEILSLRRNTATDPELRDAETQSLEAKRRSLLEQRAMLFASVA